ncbi:hypothetical protein [Ornithinibacillus bavariensis]|uniref:Lipoprotein YdeJ n=1 Tax=Ornithinibacillus bavariensis TaxID=545502 RepID=A0A920C6I8_9BACI|nr:hypothetical protein [Ornithinibacillus bavariensis]GIO27971.1 putative lipoprotein YdeJ [Ornithinibacillus bavariensis]HAM81080.1 hypothetical protein [Ornithinibacillus sp.]
MKKRTKILLFNATFIILVGCANNPTKNETVHTEESIPSSTVGEAYGNDSSDTSNVASIGTDSNTSENGDVSGGHTEENNPLSEYSNEQIEYARVWLQLGPNQEIDNLYVQHIPAGTPLNPDDETSANYPVDVIQLAGSRLVDGSVTYSGNGDGTINIYNVPIRWDGQYPAGEDFYTDIINNTKLVYIDPAEDDNIVELIRKQIIN